MTLQQLNCFVHVAKYSSFARAAELLYISQPAVSHHIRTLETELGLSLFERSLHHVSLTPAGERFYLEAIDILEHLNRAVSGLRGSSVVPEMLHIGFESTVQLYQLEDIYRSYHIACPDVSIYVHELNPADQEQMLQSGKLDVLFASELSVSTQNAEFCPLFSGYFCCVVSKNHPLAQRPLISVQDLQNETMVFIAAPNCPPEMEAIQRDIRMKCFGTTLFYSTSALYTMPMIEAELGIAVMPSFVVPPQAQVIKVPFDTKVNPRFGLLWHKSNRSDKVKKFVQIVRNCYPDTLNTQ